MDELIYLIDSFDVTAARILADKELSNCGLTKENVEITLKSFQGDEIAASVFLKKYALRDAENQIIELTLDAARDRWATAIMEAENKFSGAKDSKYFRELYDYFLPGGRQMFGLGNKYLEKISLINCYVTAIEEDSIEGIYEVAKKIARTYSYGGGIGFCIGNLRPKDAKVSNSARYSTGAVSFMELFSLTTALIGQNGRRGALLCSIPVNHPDIEDFIEIKHNNIDKVKHANISVKLTDEFMNAVVNDQDFTLSFTTKHEVITKVVRAKDLWNKLVKSARDSAEPGLLFWDTMKKMSPSEIYEGLEVVSTNPCVTGDTLVYLADGRGHLPIKQLAEENKDVPVFCFDNKQKIEVRYMRNPRITGFNLPVYKITFDDGNSIKTTENHKFLLKSGEYKEVKDLQYGDSLHTITKFKASWKDVFKECNSRSQDYSFISNGDLKTPVTEHKYVVEFHNNCRIKRGQIIHHKDFNADNNSPENLQIMTKKEHDNFHNKNMFGDKNPMRRAQTEWSGEKWEKYRENMSAAISGENNGRYSGITNDQLKSHALILTKKLGYRFSNNDWVIYAHENNLVEQFSKWRNDHFGGIMGLAKWSALECGLENIDMNPKSQRLYLKLSEQGYNCVVKDNNVYIIKNCEVCGKEFEVFHNCRESGICSKECHSLYMREKNIEIREKLNAGSRKYFANLKKENGEKQIKIFLDLKQKLGREPLKKELERECKDRDVSYRIGKPSFFSSYEELKECASQYNHKVVSVEFVGFEDVYNGTVDEFHNFFIGGFEGITDKNKRKFNYFNNLQCGEQILSNGDSCCLGSLLLHKFVLNPYTENAQFDFDKFATMVWRGVRHLDDIVEINLERHPLKEQGNIARKGRRIGLGLTGLADTLLALNLKYDTEEALGFIERLMTIKRNNEYLASIDLAKERGAFPVFTANHYDQSFSATLPENIKEMGRQFGQRNVAISTVAPNGSLSIMAQCSSGIEPVFALSYKRYVEMGGKKRKEFTIFHPGLVRYFHVTGEKSANEKWVVAHEVDYTSRIKLQHTIQAFTDASISSTINLPNDVSEEKVGQIYIDAWKNQLKGITVYREGSREGILITDEFEKFSVKPEMDTIIQCVKAEGGDKFYVMTSYKEQDVKKPYQIFVLNYKQTEKDSFIKVSNALIKMLKTKGVSDKRINKYVDRSKNSLERVTRFLSLSMKTDCLDDAVQVLDEYAFAGTLVSRLHNILNKSLKASKSACKKCGSSNVRMEEGCMVCLDCLTSGCG